MAARVSGTDFPPARNRTPSDRLARALERIEATDHWVRAWEAIDRESAETRAAELSAPATVPAGSPLRGTVLGVKDVVDVAGLPTKAGSRAWAGAAPAAEDAVVVERLRRAGCIVLGKTKTTEFAFIDPTDTVNPANQQHTPGGSSSGSAAAVAAGGADLAIGTQTVGSVCRPAAFCGVAAFKPSTGTMPATGVVAFARTYDTVGFMARDMRIAYEAYRHSREEDGDRLPRPDSRSWSGTRIGIVGDSFYADCDASVVAALATARDRLADGGATVVRLETGCDFADLRQQHRTVIFREAADAHAGLLREPDALGPHWRQALEHGARITDSAYWQARDRLTGMRNRLAAVCSDVDFLLLPPARTPAPRGLHSTGDAALIVPWTVYGGPLAVLPVGRTEEGLPTAVMLCGHPMDDDAVGTFAISLQSALSEASRVAAS